MESENKNLELNFTDFRDYTNEQLEFMNNAGLAVSVFTSDKVLFEEGFGYRDIAKKLPITSETIFPIASHSKSFTSTAIAILVDDGLLDWDTPVRSYYPKFKLNDRMASEKATIRDILSHTTGLPNHQFMVMNSDWTYKEIVNRLPYLEPIYDFRTKFHYCNLHYILASYLIEELSGKPFFTFVRDRILKPLKMDNTNFSIKEMNKSTNKTKGYNFTNNGFEEQEYLELKNIAAGAGCINSCLDDMHKWIQFHLNKGKVNGKQLISEEKLRELYVVQRLNQNDLYMQIIPDKNYVQASGYGLGWSSIFYRGGKIIQHYGGGLGVACNAGFLPQQDVGYVIFSNTTGSTTPAYLNVLLADQILGLDIVNWGVKIKEMWVKMNQAMKMRREEANKLQSTKTKPSHPLKDYIGVYKHPAYGKLEFSLEENQLKASYGNASKLPVEHYNFDSFKMRIDSFKETKNILFKTNFQGEISSLEINAEPALKPAVFEKIS